MNVAQVCLENISPSKFSSLADLYPDLVSHLHTKIRLMGNLCLNGGIPWPFKTEGSLCFICEEDTETVYHNLFQYKEVFNVSSQLKSGVSGVLIDYEHIRFGGPILWKLLHDLYQVFFNKSSVFTTLKTGLVLPLFKGKGTKANNKDNYRGITLFPTLCKIYEMIIPK